MSLLLSTPDRHGLTGTVDVLRSWQSDRAPMQLHPGDLGWYERHGTQRAATAVRTWSRDRKSTRLNSSHVAISYAVFCLKKKKKRTIQLNRNIRDKNESVMQTKIP